MQQKINGSHVRTIALIGVNQEAADLLSSLLKKDEFRVVKVLNPEIEDIQELLRFPSLDIIINTCIDPAIADDLRKLKLNRTDIMSGLSAQLLYCTGSDELQRGDVPGYRTKILTSLHEVRRSVYLAKNKEELLKLILSIATHSLHADSGSIMLTDPKKKFLSIEMAEGLESAIVNSTVQRIGTGIAGTVAKTGKSLLIKGKPDDSLQQHERYDLVSAICSPLIIGKEVVGVLNINSKTPGRVFCEEDLLYLKRLAEFVADVIKTSKDYEQSADSSFSLTLLSQAREILNLEYPFDERLNLVLMKIVNTFNGEICNYYTFNSENQMFLVQSSSSFNINSMRGKLIKLNDFFASRVLRTKNQFCFHLQLTNNGARKWYIAQPVKNGEEIIGLIFLHLITDQNNLTKEKKTIERIARMLSQEILKDNSIQTTRMQSIKYSAISELTFDFARVHNVRQLAKMIVSNACLIMEAESCVLSLYNKNMSSFEALDSYTIKNEKHIDNIRKLNSVIALKASNNGSIVMIPDLHASGYVGEGITTNSVLSICIRKAGNPIASLSLYDKTPQDITDKRSFTNADKEVFVKYCQQASKALERFLMVDSTTR